jgi:hypothetical protein
MNSLKTSRKQNANAPDSAPGESWTNCENPRNRSSARNKAVVKRLTALLGLLLPAFGFAQSYSIDWYKIAGGGGASTGGVYAVSGTIGQHDAANPMTGGVYSLTGGFWALFAVQTPGAPLLRIASSGNKVVLSWSVYPAGFALENNSSLAVSNGWSAILTEPVVVGDFNYVTNSINPGNSFYRLHHL